MIENMQRICNRPNEYICVSTHVKLDVKCTWSGELCDGRFDCPDRQDEDKEVCRRARAGEITLLRRPPRKNQLALFFFLSQLLSRVNHRLCHYGYQSIHSGVVLGPFWLKAELKVFKVRWLSPKPDRVCVSV